MNLVDIVNGLVQATVTWFLVASVAAMRFMDIEVPDWYQTMTLMVLAFWFGQQGGLTGNIERVRRTIRDELHRGQ